MTIGTNLPGRWNVAIDAEDRVVSKEVIDLRGRYGAGSAHDFDLADLDLDRRFAAFARAEIDDATRRWFIEY